MRTLFLSLALICGLAGQAKAYFSYIPAPNKAVFTPRSGYTPVSDGQSSVPQAVRPPVQSLVPSPTLVKAVPPAVSSVPAAGKQRMLLPKAVLTVLPYDWRYTIADSSKRMAQVSWPGNVPWREAIQGMAAEAACSIQFDEKAKRVTLAATDLPRSNPSVPTSAPPVSALHPASLPEPVAVAPLTPKPEVKVEPKVIQDALADATPVPSVSPVPAPPIASVAVEQQDFHAPASAASWVITPGPLKPQMETWAEQAGYHVVWKSTYDYMVQARSVFSGDFISAVTSFFEQLHLGGNSGVRVTIHQDNKIMEVRHE